MAETKTKKKQEKEVEEQDERSFIQRGGDVIRRIPKGVIIEIVLLGITLANTLLPLPWRLILPFVTGIWTIWVKYRDDTTLRRAALVEGIFMSLNVAANLLPLYWRLGAFFLLGVRSIFIRYKHRHKGENKDCFCDDPDSVRTVKKDSKNAKEKQNSAGKGGK